MKADWNKTDVIGMTERYGQVWKEKGGGNVTCGKSGGLLHTILVCMEIS
jgi:hypothetical protein